MTNSVIRQAEPQASEKRSGHAWPRLDVLRHGSPLPPEARTLVEAGLAEGHGFLDQVVAFWGRDEAHYADPRAFVLLVWDGADVVGIAGLTRDPYAGDPATGRLKHVYVAPAFRRRGVGDALVREALALAEGQWNRLRLRAADPAAARLYERWGFRPTPDETSATHVHDGPGPAAEAFARS